MTASGSRLTIHRPDPTQGKITTLLSQDVFGIIRTLAAFRLAGSNKGTLQFCWLLKATFSDSWYGGQYDDDQRACSVATLLPRGPAYFMNYAETVL